MSYDESVTLALTNSKTNSNKCTEFVGFASFYAKSDTVATRSTWLLLSFSKKEVETTAGL